MKKFKIVGITALLIIAFASCNNKDEQGVPAPIGNEFLTTTILNLQNEKNASDKPTISYQVVGDSPVVVRPDTLVLQKDSKYKCSIVILDVTKTPVDTVSLVIKERANYHLFFFFPSAGLNLTDSITDLDTNVPPLPVGLESVMTTTQPSTGSLEVVLRHQPNVKNGTYPPGSTDLDVFYPVKIE